MGCFDSLMVKDGDGVLSKECRFTSGSVFLTGYCK